MTIGYYRGDNRPTKVDQVAAKINEIVDAVNLLQADTGGLVTEAGYYSGSNVSVGASAVEALQFDILDSGDAVLDITNPFLPVAVKAGLFSVSIEVVMFTMSEGGEFQVSLTLDYGGDNPEIKANCLAGAVFTGPSVCLSGEYELEVGGAIKVTVTNADSGSRTASIKNATISRVGPA